MYNTKSRLYMKAMMTHTPIGGVFEITPVCNMRCKMCYVNKTSPLKCITLEKWKQICDSAEKRGLLYLLITGGEPFLCPDFFDIYYYARKKGIAVSINTNATAITDEIIEKLALLPPERINITVYGASDETYERLCKKDNGFTLAKKAIEKLISRGINVALNYSVTKENAADLKEVCRLAHDLGLLMNKEYYIFRPADCKADDIRLLAGDAGRLKAEIDFAEKGEQAVKKVECESCNGFSTCIAGKASFVVSYDGKMRACVTLESEFAPSLDDYTFDEAWEIVGNEMKNVKIPKECTECKMRGLCPVCASACVSEGGDAKVKPEYLCEMTRAYCDEIKKLQKK